MIVFPNAKINLGLNIINKRPDGYHNLESCFYPIGWSDVLEVIPSNQLEFTSSGIAIPGDKQHNLCLRAYDLVSADFGISPVKIHLHKIIPIGAGLGGGSSDGAFTLKMLNEIFELNLSQSRLESYANHLGSDCPFFIDNKPKYVAGTGNTFNEISLNLSGKKLVIIKPDIHISTAEAYAGINPHTPDLNCRETIQSQTIENWKAELINDFEQSIFPNHTEISTLKNKLYDQGALYASMTGSGAAVFGIFDRHVNVKTSIKSTWQQLLP